MLCDEPWVSRDRNIRIYATGLIHFSNWSYRVARVEGRDGLVRANEAEETDDPVTCIGCLVVTGFAR